MIEEQLACRAREFVTAPAMNGVDELSKLLIETYYSGKMAAEDQIEKLTRFKTYVHGRLDEAGIDKDPESPHKADGCRIGGRLDIALRRHESGWGGQ